VKHIEDNIQAGIVKLLRLNGFLVFSVPNGGQRSAITGAILKKTGALAGVSDLIIVLDSRVVFVEVKTATGRQQDTQKVFQERVEQLGHRYEIWRSIRDCAVFINNEKKMKKRYLQLKL